MTRISGSLSENYQTEPGYRALIWRKNGCEYVLQRDKEIWKRRRDDVRDIPI